MLPRMKVVVLDAGTLDFEPQVWGDLNDFCEVVLHDTTATDPDLIRHRIEGAEAVFTNKVPMDAATIEQASALKFIGVLATGYNVIDIPAAQKASVTVCHVPTYGTATTAQHAVALILELCNQVGASSRSVHAGEWITSQHFSYWEHAPVEVSGLTVGVIGFGRIGRTVAATMHA